MHLRSFSLLLVVGVSFTPPLGAQERLTLKGHVKGVLCVAFSPDGKTLATGSSDETVKLWDAATGQEKAALKGHNQPVHSVAFSPDGKVVASGGWDGSIKLWDVATGKEKRELIGHKIIYSLAFSP